MIAEYSKLEFVFPKSQNLHTDYALASYEIAGIDMATDDIMPKLGYWLTLLGIFIR